MTPLYNGSEYYKKMLDLQERLRKSEEERIRLEERFSLLEHESRSRHETCINRLRMRYIDFLEEQQARDERNHQLLGALDRVDSSLALMSAKTDRLGALRKQYEASMLGSYDNRRPNSSLTGDSGVASQNDERQRRCDIASLRTNNVNEAFPHNQHQSRGSYRSSEPPSQVRSGSATPYANAWSAIRCESSHQPSLAFSRFTQGGTSLLTPRTDDFSSRLLDNGHANPRNFLASKSSPIARQATTESSNRNGIAPRASSAYDLRNANDSSACPHSNRPLRQNRQAFLPAPISKYGASVPKHSDDVSARFDNPYARSNESSPTSRRNSIFPPGQGGRNENRPITSGSPNLSAILREELGDGEDEYGEEDEEDDYIGGIVENQLERYISKIRSLHRDAEPRSIEEIDHEEANTSGDLLNASLSDDALDLPIEEKQQQQQPRADSFPRELGNVLALAKDLADRTAASATNVANNICQDEPPIAIGPRREDSRDSRPIGPSVTAHRLPSIDVPHDQHHHPSYEELESPAKNGISLDVAKSAAELASRPTRNTQDIAKLARNPGTENDKIVSSRDPSNVAMPGEDARISGHPSDEPSRELASGEQRETDENLDDALEDLEPWNLSALERRVQEIILNDEAQNDFVVRGIRNVGHASVEPRQEDDVAQAGDESTVSRVGERQMGERVDENAEISGTDAPRSNGATRVVHERDTTDETRREPSKKNEGDSRSEEHARGSLSTAEESTPQKDLAARREQENVEGTNHPAANEADPGIEHGQGQADYASRENESHGHGQYEDPNVRYEYNAEGPYEPNERYNLNENSEYDGYQGQRYEYAEGQYDQAPDQLGHVQNPVDQQEYVQGPQEYGQDPSRMEYLQDTNQQYEAGPVNEQYSAGPADQRHKAGPINEQYSADPADQRYEAGPVNEQYSADPADQRYKAGPINEQYSADPADQRYKAGPVNEQYSAVPADQRYEVDPVNEQYGADPADQRYKAGPINEQYSADPADHRYEAGPINEQYGADPADQRYEAGPINEQYSADPADQRYEADPVNEQYGADPADQRYEAGPVNEQYGADPADQRYEAGPINEQYSADPADQLYEAGPANEQYGADPADQRYEADPVNEQYGADPADQRYEAGPNEQYLTDPNQQYTVEGDGRYPESTCEQNPADFNERGNTDQLYAADEQYSENPDQRYLNDPGQEYVDPNQQYSAEAGYAQGEIQEYPYPAEYANSELQGQEGTNVGPEAEEHVQKSLETVDAPKAKVSPKEDSKARKSKDVIKSILDSDTESTIERNVSNTESDFDFN